MRVESVTVGLWYHTSIFSTVLPFIHLIDVNIRRRTSGSHRPEVGRTLLIDQNRVLIRSAKQVSWDNTHTKRAREREREDCSVRTCHIYDIHTEPVQNGSHNPNFQYLNQNPISGLLMRYKWHMIYAEGIDLLIFWSFFFIPIAHEHCHIRYIINRANSIGATTQSHNSSSRYDAIYSFKPRCTAQQRMTHFRTSVTVLDTKHCPSDYSGHAYLVSQEEKETIMDINCSYLPPSQVNNGNSSHSSC